MIALDWIVLIGTLLFIILYGVYRARGNDSMSGYLRGGNSMGWGTIGLSVMATQASAITFLSTPGQAYESGMAFVQNYFGLPLAIIIVSYVFIPIYYRLKVYTAYEYLEGRFDTKSRVLAAFIFLVQRGMGAGITIYAPAIILSKVLGLNLNLTILIVGILVVLYTVSGGTKAVSLTQKYQMLVIFGGLFIAFGILIYKLPEAVGFQDALGFAGAAGKLNAIDFSFDLEKRYTFWSGITGGLFLSLGYFGSDESQVQRYLGGSNITQSRLGMLFNAVLKIPMQFFILFVGVMLFVFYQFEQPPVFFNESELNKIESAEQRNRLDTLSKAYTQWHQENKSYLLELAVSENEISQDDKERIMASSQEGVAIRTQVKDLLIEADESANVKDSDYVFISFVMKYLPHGIIGLLLAVIFSAAMSSTAGELNALGSTTVVDIHKRFIVRHGTDRHYLNTSKWITAIWGIIAIVFAFFASLVENLIEFVNIIGSIFYGTVLGIFLVAFFVKWVKGNAVFFAAVLVQLFIFFIHYQVVQGNWQLSYLMYNLIGCSLVVIISMIFQFVLNKSTK